MGGRTGQGVEGVLQEDELVELRAFMAATARLFTPSTMMEKLLAAGSAFVESGLFGQVAVRVYRQRFSARCLVAGAGVSEAALDRLRNAPNPETDVEMLVRRAEEVAPSCFRITSRPKEPWGVDDSLVAVLRVGATAVGDIQAAMPSPSRVRPDRLEWLGIFVSLVDQVLDQDLRSRVDRLTRAFNAGYLDLIVARLGRTKGVFTAVYADMDGLKEVNDTFGHRVGDRFIQAAHDILLRAFPADGLIYRPYGDEFVYLREAEDPTPVKDAAEGIPRLVAGWNRRAKARGWPGLGIDPVLLMKTDAPLPALQLSVGWAHGQSAHAETVIRKAEERMYWQKALHHAGRA